MCLPQSSYKAVDWERLLIEDMHIYWCPCSTHHDIHWSERWYRLHHLSDSVCPPLLPLYQYAWRQKGNLTTYYLKPHGQHCSPHSDSDQHSDLAIGLWITLNPYLTNNDQWPGRGCCNIVTVCWHNKLTINTRYHQTIDHQRKPIWMVHLHSWSQKQEKLNWRGGLDPLILASK